MKFPFQRIIFESCPWPELAAVLSGYAAFTWFGDLVLTRAGEDYLAQYAAEL